MTRQFLRRARTCSLERAACGAAFTRHSDDPAMSKHGRHDLVDAAIAAVGEHAAMQVAQSFDRGASVMNAVVAVARATTCDGDDATVAMADEDLEVARPAVGLGFRGDAVVARWHERTVDDPRAAPITERAGREKRRDARHEVVTIRCTCETDIPNTAASSRKVRFVRRLGKEC